MYAGELIEKATAHGPQPTAHTQPDCATEHFPHVLPVGIGALKGDSLMAQAGGGGYRPFTYTMRQMSYLLSLERWVARVVAPIFLRIEFVSLVPFPPWCHP